MSRKRTTRSTTITRRGHVPLSSESNSASLESRRFEAQDSAQHALPEPKRTRVLGHPESSTQVESSNMKSSTSLTSETPGVPIQPQPSVKPRTAPTRDGSSEERSPTLSPGHPDSKGYESPKESMFDQLTSHSFDSGSDSGSTVEPVKRPRSREDLPILEGDMLHYRARVFNKALCCGVCKGYLRSATTITECLHSFCRSCLFRRFVNVNTCPKCDVSLLGNPRDLTRPDHTLQTVVDLLHPELVERDNDARNTMYTRLKPRNTIKAVVPSLRTPMPTTTDPIRQLGLSGIQKPGPANKDSENLPILDVDTGEVKAEQSSVKTDSTIQVAADSVRPATRRPIRRKPLIEEITFVLSVSRHQQPVGFELKDFRLRSSSRLPVPIIEQ